MTELIFQTFTLMGLCFILKYGKILNPVRDFLIKNSEFSSKIPEFFKDLFKCSMCLGFWVGLFWGVVWDGFDFFKILSWGFYSAAVCWFGDYITMVVDKYIE